MIDPVVRAVHTSKELAARALTVDELIAEHQAKHYEPPAGNGNWPHMHRFVLPHRQAGNLLRRLNDCNVNSGTIYPNYDGAAQAVRDRQYWDD